MPQFEIYCREIVYYRKTITAVDADKAEEMAYADFEEDVNTFESHGHDFDITEVIEVECE